MATNQTEESVHCVSCGGDNRMEVVEAYGPTPKDVPNTGKDWTRYWAKCFNCGGRQFYDHPDADLIKPVESEEFVEKAIEGPQEDLRALADNSKSLAGPSQPA